LGHIKDPLRLADLLAKSDAFVHPNPREPFGIGPLEAMASGLPLVAPNCGGVTSYANSENAWLVPPDAVSFAAAIEDVFVNDSRTERVQNALRAARQFGWESVASLFCELYSQLCGITAESHGEIPLPDFCSEQATGFEFVCSRTISRGAERAFHLIAAFLDQRDRAG
jgi:hypothetical protein